MFGDQSFFNPNFYYEVFSYLNVFFFLLLFVIFKGNKRKWDLKDYYIIMKWHLRENFQLFSIII